MRQHVDQYCLVSQVIHVVQWYAIVWCCVVALALHSQHAHLYESDSDEKFGSHFNNYK